MGQKPLVRDVSQINKEKRYRFAKADIRNERREKIEESIFDGAGVELEARCKEIGIELRHSACGKHGIRGSQWDFFRDMWSVAKYWPTTGTLKIGCITQNAASLADALEKVFIAVGPPKPGPRQHGPRPEGKPLRKHHPRPEGTADKPEPAKRRGKSSKHESRKGDTHAGDVKTLYSMVRGAVRRCRKNLPAITDGDIRAVLADVGKLFDES